jgi:hypothetical protein
MHKIPGNFFGMKGVYIASTPIVQEGRKAIVVILKKRLLLSPDGVSLKLWATGSSI